jgi:predicted transcriptional regulator
VKSIRLRDDLIVKIDTLAARERRKIYEIVEEALVRYLEQRQQA